MRFIFTLLLKCLLQAAEPQRHQFDLQAALRDAAALQRLKIQMYRHATQAVTYFLFMATGLLFGKQFPIDRWR